MLFDLHELVIQVVQWAVLHSYSIFIPLFNCLIHMPTVCQSKYNLEFYFDLSNG